MFNARVSTHDPKFPKQYTPPLKHPLLLLKHDGMACVRQDKNYVCLNHCNAQTGYSQNTVKTEEEQTTPLKILDVSWLLC